MEIYRRRLGKDAWHWCTNCTNWPKRDYVEVERSMRPTTYELCDQCLARDKAGKCKTNDNPSAGARGKNQS